MKILILSLILVQLFTVSNAADCVEKSFKTGTVCVCDLKSCDEVPALDLTMGQAAVYTTSHSGNRLHRDVVYPTDNEPFGTIHMTIDTSKKFQKIKGFGSTFSDASGANLQSLPDQLADTLIRQYFSPQGLGLSLGRVPIASTDFSLSVYSYDEHQEDYLMQNFNLTTEDFKWKIPYIKAAQKYSNQRLQLLGVSWSAPSWLKTTNSMGGYGTLKGKTQDTYHTAYAKYFVRFLEEYNKVGLPIWAISTQNEPTKGNDKKNKVQSTYFTAETQRDFIKNDLGPALKASSVGMNVEVLILDDERSNLPKWADTILKDKEAVPFISGIAVHSYGDSASDKHLDETNKKHPGFYLLSTEASQGYNPKDVKPLYGSWDRAENYAADIIDDMNNYLSGWMERNLILSEQGGPSWAEDYADAPVIAVPATAQFYKQPMWYAIGQFSRFIQPGAYRIEHTLNVIELEVHSSAFVNPDGTIVIVMLNTGSITAHTVVVRNAADSYNHYQFKLPTRSITTLYIQTV